MYYIMTMTTLVTYLVTSSATLCTPKSTCLAASCRNPCPCYVFITLLHRFLTPQRCYLNCTALSFLFVLLTQLIVSLSTLVNLGGHEALETRYKSEWNSPLNFLNHFFGNSQITSLERKDFVSMDAVYLIILQFICIVQRKK